MILENIDSDKPFAVLDLETTGTNIAKDRIIQIAILRESLFAPDERFSTLVNPCQPIPPKVTELTGITDDAVSGALTFQSVAEDVHRRLKGAVLVGFNLINFDVPLLWEEFHRVGIEWDLAGVEIIDAGNIFKKMEPRTLSAAVRKYAGREHVNAHDALADVIATAEVLAGQVKTLIPMQAPGGPDLNAAHLADFSTMDELDGEPVRRIDLAGVMVRDADGVARFTAMKVRGEAVRENVGFARWILKNDFTENTKAAVRKELNGLPF